MLLRSGIGVLLIAMAAFAGEASARDRAATCRVLSARGQVWAYCCKQSYTRNPSRVLTQRTRLRQIERCVRTRQRRS